MRRLTFGPAHAFAKTLAVLLALALIASVAASPAFAADKRRSFSKADDNSDATVRLGDIIAVWLPVQMGTGASWKVVGLPETLERNGVRTIRAGEDRPGAAETQIFWFRAKKRGIGKLTLAKGRPWEFTDPPLDTFLLKIAVE
ncbi:MAG: protease inhibitor I42 family protein [Rhodomicrobium sp.]